MIPYDMKDYRRLISSTLKEANDNPDHKWRIQKVTKYECVIEWSYLSPNEVFRVRLRQSTIDDEWYVAAEDPHADTIIVLVGTEFYHDTSTMEDAVRIAVDALVSRANHIY